MTPLFYWNEATIGPLLSQAAQFGNHPPAISPWKMIIRSQLAGRITLHLLRKSEE